MLSKRTFGEDHDVVNVDDYDVFHVGEDFVHHSLEHSQGVAESKEHDSGFIESLVANEHSFPFVSFLDSYVIVSPPKVYLHEVLRSLELVDELRDKREGVVISYCMLVQVLVVLNHPLSSVLLWHEEYGRRLFRLGQADIPFGELLVDEL